MGKEFDPADRYFSADNRLEEDPQLHLIENDDFRFVISEFERNCVRTDQGEILAVPTIRAMGESLIPSSNSKKAQGIVVSVLSMLNSANIISGENVNLYKGNPESRVKQATFYAFDRDDMQTIISYIYERYNIDGGKKPNDSSLLKILELLPELWGTHPFADVLTDKMDQYKIEQEEINKELANKPKAIDNACLNLTGIPDVEDKYLVGILPGMIIQENRRIKSLPNWQLDCNRNFEEGSCFSYEQREAIRFVGTICWNRFKRLNFAVDEYSINEYVKHLDAIAYIFAKSLEQNVDLSFKSVFEMFRNNVLASRTNS